MKEMSHSKIFSEVERTIRMFGMFQKKDSVLVGISGGPDSVALLRLLIDMREKIQLSEIGVAHLNHCLRGNASDNDAEFVRSLAESFHLPFYVSRSDVKAYQKKNRLSLEEAAREVRYAFLEETAEKNDYNKIALGHNSDENAELVLMQLLRGSGLLGMAGIPPVRDNIVRPFIYTDKKTILKYLKGKDQPFVLDGSNEDTRFLRNRIRKKLIPELRKYYNPNIVDTVNRLATIARGDEEWMESITESLFNDAVLFKEDDEIGFDVDTIIGLHIAVKRRIIRKAVKMVKGDLRRFSLVHVDAAIRLFENRKESKSLDFPGMIRVKCLGNRFVITREKENLRNTGEGRTDRTAVVSFEYIIGAPEPGHISQFIKEAGFYLYFCKTTIEKLPDIHYMEKHIAYMDLDAITFPLIVRSTKAGDRFRPFGMSGTQKLKKYFINNKVEKPARESASVILSGNEIVWVVGHRISETVRLTSKTTNVLKIEAVFPDLTK